MSKGKEEEKKGKGNREEEGRGEKVKREEETKRDGEWAIHYSEIYHSVWAAHQPARP